MPADPVPENSVTANNERQAEIEAALQRIADGTWNVGTGRNLSAREFAREALDRARDARHDENQQLECEHCGRRGIGFEVCDCGYKMVPARSPQGEDHDELEAAYQHGYDTGRIDEKEAAIKAGVFRNGAPARDARHGITTVEDVARLSAELQALVDWFNDAPFLRAERLLRDLDHEHEWVDARNSSVESGEVCIRCGAIRVSELAPDDTQYPNDKENDERRH